MGRVTEAVRRFVFREKLLQRFEKEVVAGEAATIDVHLRKGTEYVVEGAILKSRAKPVLSLGDVHGLARPCYVLDTQGRFYFTPDKDGFYTIRVAVEAAAARQEAATVSIALCAVLPSHQCFESPWVFPRYFALPPAVGKEPAGETPTTEAAVRDWEAQDRRVASQRRN